MLNSWGAIVDQLHELADFRSLRLGFFDLDGFGEQPESWSTLMRRVVLLEDTRAWNWCCQYDANILHIPLRYVEHLIFFL